MRIILSCSVYSSIVYISCIMQHVNNILIVSKKITKICAQVTRDPVSGFRVGIAFTWSVRKVSDLWPGKRNWLTWSVGHLITLKVVPLGLHTLLPAVPPLLEACRKSLFRNGV